MQKDSLTKGTRGRDEFKRYRKIIYILVWIISCSPQKIRTYCFNRSRNIKGRLGIVIRYILLKTLAEECGDNVAILEGVYLKNIEHMRFGNNVSIHTMTYIEGAGGIYIGNDVSIANGVSIISTEHNYADLSIPIKDQGIKKDVIRIANDVWIGSRAIILSGTDIGRGCIVGAGAVVTKNLKEYSIYAGVPAKFIKNRKEEGNNER